MNHTTIISPDELSEAVKWQKFFYSSSPFVIKINRYSRDEATAWENLLNKEVRANGNLEARIMALASLSLFLAIASFSKFNIIDLQMILSGFIGTVMCALVGKLLGLIQARIRLRYIAKLLLEELSMKEDDYAVYLYKVSYS